MIPQRHQILGMERGPQNSMVEGLFTLTCRCGWRTDWYIWPSQAEAEWKQHEASTKVDDA